MRTIEKTLYHFHELDDTAKAKAIEWYRSGTQCHPPTDEAIEETIEANEYEFDETGRPTWA